MENQMDLLKMTQNRMERLNFVNKGISKLGIVVRPMRKKINFFLTFTKSSFKTKNFFSRQAVRFTYNLGPYIETFRPFTEMFIG